MALPCLDTLKVERSIPDCLDFKVLHIVPPVNHSFATEQMTSLKPLKLLYTPQLPKIEDNNKVNMTKHLMPHKEALLQLEQLRQEYFEEQDRLYRLRRVPFK